LNASPPSVTAKDFIEYRPAGGWHAADNHFGPAGSVVCYLRLPAGTKIDSSRDEAWRLPLGTELIQFLYRDKSSGKHTEQPVEWRRMRQAGPGRGQMRSDGTRSDWIYEAAVRDAVTGRWKRTREDGRDAVWVRAGFGGRGTTWPVVRPHTCAACHAMAGDSPLDGPRGGHDVYSLGDLREAVWSGQLDRLKPLLSSQPSSSAVAALAAQPKPPEPADRFTSYIDALAKERGEAVVIAKVQQMTLEKSPFQPHDAQAQERGREIFLTQCAACHGKDARGDGRFALCSPVSPSLIGVRPAKLLAAMQEGSGTMPAWSDLLPGDDQWRVIEYLKTLK
jgi:mono/diheme cytochrome c family protein